MAYTWDELLDAVKVRGMVPTSQNTYTTDRFLSLATATMRSKIIPLCDKIREGYYEYDYDTAVVSTGIYRIPTRAVGAKVISVSILNGNDILPLILYDKKEVTESTTAPTGAPGYYIHKNQIYVLPPTSSGWTTVRITILLRPNAFVELTDAAQITAINTGTKTVTCTTVPTAWTTASILDLVQAQPHFDWLAVDQAISAVVTGALGTITFSSTLPTELAVGDWVSLFGETPVIQCPVELHPLLAQEIANVCLRAQNDKTGYELGLAESKALTEGLIPVLTPRSEKSAKKIVNRSGILRRGL